MLFTVKGVGYAGEPFSSRFESASKEVLREWMIEDGITVTEVRVLPLTSGPYSKLPWLILAFPVLVGLLVITSARLVSVAASGALSGWGELVLIVSLEVGLSVIVCNILLRLGSQYDFGGDRVVQYAKGPCVSTSKDAEENAEVDA
jgi:hypothetical protein